jgi:predicted RNA-binding protein associated with RNAse of E/G family
MHLKVETHDLAAKTHTVKAGTFPVALYLEHSHGVYVERAFVGHPRVRYWKAHILPEQHLQICQFTTHHGDSPFEFYIDIVKAEREGPVLRVKDLYLDLGIAHNQTLTLLDTHELFEAVDAGYIHLYEALLATQTLHGLINRLGQHQNHLARTLQAQGIVLEWDGRSPSPDHT